MSRQSEKIVRHFRNLSRRSGEVVAYKRDGQILIAEVSMVPGDSSRIPVREGAATVVQGDSSWLALASDIVTIGTPTQGDEITLGARVWRVSKFGGVAFKECDPLGLMIRIFAKPQKTAEATPDE